MFFPIPRVGTKQSILVENETTGRTLHYAPVNLDFPANGGDIVDVRITDTDGRKLFAGHLE